MVIAKDRTLHLRVLVRNAIYCRYKPFMSKIDFRLLLFYIYEGNILCLHTGSDLQYNPMDIINGRFCVVYCCTSSYEFKESDDRT